MGQEDLSAVGRRGHEQTAPQGYAPIPASDEVVIKEGAGPDYILFPAKEVSASEAASVVSKHVLHSEQFETSRSKTTLLDVPEIRVPRSDEMLVARAPQGNAGLRVAPVAGVLMTTLGIGLLGGWTYYGWLDPIRRELSGKNAIATAVERIIQAESSGCTNAKNKRSTATGAGQFIDETWLRLIRAHRPQLAKGSEREVLELRRDRELAREITARLAEHNAAKLRQRGFSVTPSSLYLSHFAGSAGAVAILSAPESADAASVMASADITGRTTREKIVNANPFLKRFTVADLKSWADRKMDNRQVHQACRRDPGADGKL
jgi:hypothetical protein